MILNNVIYFTSEECLEIYEMIKERDLVYKVMKNKMFGIVKWFKDIKGYGYIVGVDDETYFFERIDCVNKNDNFISGDKVRFIPSFIDMDYAKEVEKVESYE